MNRNRNRRSPWGRGPGDTRKRYDLGDAQAVVYLWRNWRQLLEVAILTGLLRLWRVWLTLAVCGWVWIGVLGGTQAGLYWTGALLCGYLTARIWWRKRRGTRRFLFPRLREARELRGKVKGLWPLAATRSGLTYQGRSRNGAVRTPKLHDLHSRGEGTVSATIYPDRSGLTFEDFEKAVGTINDIVGCLQVSIKKERTRLGWRVPISFHWLDPMHRTLPIADVPLPTQEPGKPPKLAYGTREDGVTPAWIWSNQSTLLGGLTRRGKSNTIYALIHNALKQGIPVRLYISDPKGGIDMAPFEQYVGTKDSILDVRVYTATVSGTIDMVDQVEKAMQVRGREMRSNGQFELLTYDQRNPWTVVILDELLFLGPMLKQGADSAIGRILNGGSALGIIVLANTQAGKINVVGDVRDLFPQRICYATKGRHVTDAILGDYAEAQGALCSTLGNQRGVGWSYSDEDSRAQKFRTGLVTREQKHTIASGRVIRSEVVEDGTHVVTSLRDRFSKTRTGAVIPIAVRKWAIYMFRDDKGGLLYIGKTNDSARRFLEHSKHQPWWAEVGTWEVKLLPPGTTEQQCLEMEERLIKKMHPKYNKQHNTGKVLQLKGRP